MLRKLKIYHQFGIGDTETIECLNYLEKLFSGLTLSLDTYGDITYSMNGKLVMANDTPNNCLWVDYNTLWQKVSIYGNKKNSTIAGIVDLIMYRIYKRKSYPSRVSADDIK